MFDDLLAAAGRTREDYFNGSAVDPFYRIFDRHRAQPSTTTTTTAFILDQIEQVEPGGPRRLPALHGHDPGHLPEGLCRAGRQAVPALDRHAQGRAGPDQAAVATRASTSYVSQFVKDDFLRRCFSFHPLLIGGNPFDAPSIYAMIHYLEREWGIHYAMGGTGADCGRRWGGCSTSWAARSTSTARSARSWSKGRRVTGVRLATAARVHADHVVSNADVAFTYRNLIPRAVPPQVQRPASIDEPEVQHVALRHLLRHQAALPRAAGWRTTTSSWASATRACCNDIFKKKALADDFSLYLHMPTLDRSVHGARRPRGVLRALAGAAPGRGHRLDERMAKPYRDRIMRLPRRELPARPAGEHRRRAL